MPVRISKYTGTSLSGNSTQSYAVLVAVATRPPSGPVGPTGPTGPSAA